MLPLSRYFAFVVLVVGLSVLSPNQGEGQEPKQPENSLPSNWTKLFNWRSIGPANMSGRITALAVFEADPTCFYVATASGGLLKTVNNGISFEHQFDHETTVSIGAVAVSQTDRNIVWVGTGEANPRNSVSYGDGVYKSTDGGKKWQNMGLKGGFQTGQIVIHPKNPNIVYVGVLGRLYGPNDERGLYKTINAGATWEKVLAVDDKTGVMDIIMHPTELDTLIAATWERKRDEFDGFFPDQAPDAVEQYGPIVTYGAGSGLHRTTDGGKTWTKLTKGLPTTKMGRIGLDWSRKDPKNVYAIISSEKVGTGTVASPVFMGILGETDEGAKLTQVTKDSPAEKAGLKEGDVIVGVNGKKIEGYEELIVELQTFKANDKIKVDALRKKEKLAVEVTLAPRPETPPPQGVMIGINTDETPKGLRISSVIDGGAAKKAGLLSNDFITAIDGKAIKTVADMRAVLMPKKAGDEVKVTVLRGEEKKEFPLTLQPRTSPPMPKAKDNARPYVGYLVGQQSNIQNIQGPDGFQTGGVYKSSDGGESWARLNSLNPRPMYFSVVRVDPNDENTLYVLGISSYRSTNGGRIFRPIEMRGVHADHHALWINPANSRHLMIGTDGGFCMTYDHGAKWDHISTVALGQFYHVATDNRRPYRVYGGLQDNGSWAGPSQVMRGGGPINFDFVSVNGGDGFVCRIDRHDPDLIYAESQNGRMSRQHLKTGESSSIGVESPKDGPKYRFNWNTPFILSERNSSILYCAGNFVFRSYNRGDNWQKISPEITRTPRGSGTAVAESPKNPDVLWAGTDDGALWVSRDAGMKWTNVADKVGLPGPRWVATIEPSRTAEGRAYVCFDAHRSNDDAPYIYVTENFGETWKSLRSNLPMGSSRVLREDIVNPELLYVGTEFGAWASTNRGESWTKINNNLPTVAIHEFAQPTTANEIVVATHGRSLWVLDITSLRQATPAMFKADATLFAPSNLVRWSLEPGRQGGYSPSARLFAGKNAERTPAIEYVIRKPAEKVTLKITDVQGRKFRDLKASPSVGIHRIAWDLTLSEPQPMGAPQNRTAPFGTYRVVLTVDGKEYIQPITIERDPNNPQKSATVDEPMEEEEEEEMRRIPD